MSAVARAFFIYYEWGEIMANWNWPLYQEVDLRTGAVTSTVWPNTIMETGDANSHTWKVTVKDDGESIDLTGALAVGYFIRSDSATVPVSGTVSGDTVTIVMPASCFVVRGRLDAVLKVTLGSMIITITTAVLNVRGDITDRVVDPGTEVPNLQELITASATCTAAAAAAIEAAADAESFVIYQKLIAEVIPNTVQTITKVDGKVTQILHKNGNVAVRTDAFSYGDGTITETRTLNTGDVLTIVTNLSTLATAVTYTAAA